MKSALWICISGASVGWMLGLSASPVFETFLAPILGIIVASLAALASLQEQSDRVPKIGSFFPIALFLLSCSLALPIGIYVRTGNYLDADLQDGSFGTGQFNSPLNESSCSILHSIDVEQAKDRIPNIKSIGGDSKRLLLFATADEAVFRNVVELLCN